MKEIRRNVAELCRELVRTPSLSGEEERVGKLVEKRMREFGYDQTNIDSMGNVVGTNKGSPKKPLILFEGHLDTVPPGERSSWRHDPFSGRICGDRISGRGTVDMKGAIAAMILIPSIMKALGWKTMCRMTSAFVVLEEPCEGVGIEYLIAGMRSRPSAVVLGEPSNLCLAMGQRGRVEIRIRAKGKASHSSMPERGINAIYEMRKAIDGLEQIEKHLPSHDVLGPASITGFRIFSSPKEGNIVPEVCDLLVDRRTLPFETESKIIKEIKAVVPSKCEVGINELTIETCAGKKRRIKQFFPGWILEKDHWLAHLVGRAAEEVMGQPPGYTTWRFGTDGTYTAGVASIPTIGYGPGDPEIAHMANENASISDIATAALVYSFVAKSFAK